MTKLEKIKQKLISESTKLQEIASSENEEAKQSFNKTMSLLY